jgi:hypothetical protein
MDKKIDVKCECEGAGFIAVADDGGEGVEHVECGQHHPAFKDAPSVDELRHRQRLVSALRIDASSSITKTIGQAAHCWQSDVEDEAAGNIMNS